MMAQILIAGIRLYQWMLAPWLGAHCRFEPSCSAYAIMAMQQFGAWRGGCLALQRLARCHPWAAGGYDPLPTAADHQSPQCNNGEGNECKSSNAGTG